MKPQRCQGFKDMRASVGISHVRYSQHVLNNSMDMGYSLGTIILGAILDSRVLPYWPLGKPITDSTVAQTIADMGSYSGICCLIRANILTI